MVASNVYVDHIDKFNAMNRMYTETFRQPYPARTTVQAAVTGATLTLAPSTGSAPPAEGPQITISVIAVS